MRESASPPEKGAPGVNALNDEMLTLVDEPTEYFVPHRSISGDDRPVENVEFAAVTLRPASAGER